MGIFLGMCMVWCKVTSKDSLMDDLRWEAEVLLNNAVGDNPWIKGFHEDSMGMILYQDNFGDILCPVW